ncbi:YfiR family protein [Saccharobesus litoralis]|uniref:YfiR family protein n=1 Tax=Saccharobesus litoralis TaxID=2172099 RepID=UPI00131F3EAE|nr:YfiR family protein [Saccharobesus litoralis]
MLVFYVLALPLVVYAKPQPEQVKSAFVYQVTKFTTWPQDTFESNTSNIRLCHAGYEPNLQQQLQILQTKKTKQRSFIFITIQHPSVALIEKQQCHIVYFSNESWRNLSKKDMSKLTKSTLLVGDSLSFLAHQGILAFILINDKVRIYKNLQSLRHSQLRLEARLLALAKNYKGS